ncbi:hypothetical protein JCM5350_001187 [Sporobolomyces pararoseus]
MAITEVPIAPNGAPTSRIIDGGEARIDQVLGDWAPGAPPLEGLPPSQAETYLPRAPPSSTHSHTTSSKSKYYPTSKPFNLPLNPNQESMSYSLARLLSRPRFASFLTTPLGYSQFKAYLSENASPECVAQLDLWRDLNILRNLRMQTGYAAKGISRVYRDEIGEWPSSAAKELVHGLQSTADEATSGSLEGPAKHLLDSFYASQFESFMRSRLVRHTQEQLTRYHLHASDARTGIGEAYVLVNPRLNDRPIVLVSPGFTKLTGYKASQIIGRNCRFLQGKSTSPGAVKAIKQAVDNGTDITQLILNYTSENLLTMIALHDVHGNLTYFIGGQSDLTEAMTTSEGPVSLLQSGEEVFNTDLSQLSEPVLLEAREAATTREPLEIELPPPVSSNTNGVSSPGDQTSGTTHSPTLEKLKTLCYKLVGKKPRTGHQIEEPPQGPLVPPRSVLKANKAIDSIASNYSSTYDKLLVVKQSNREILFATSGFLRHVALPGTTRQDVDRSPLIHLDLLEIVVAPTNPKDQLASKELKEKIGSAIQKGIQTSFACGIRYKGEGSGTEQQQQPQSTSTIPLVSGRLYISPLNDLFGEPAASTVVFA